MVTTEYLGRTGNNLFQYTFARLLAKKNELNLATGWPHTDFIAVEKHYDNIYGDIEEPEIVVDDMYSQDHRRELLDGNYRKMRVKCRGFFQNADFYNDHREEIRSWFEPRMATNQGYAIHLRLTDFWWYKNKSVIHPSFYHRALKMSGFRKGDPLYIIVEPHETNIGYLREFSGYNPKIISQSPAADFKFLRSCENIVCSNSTFAWWAAFLSNAKNIFTFGPWMNKKGIPLANMAGATVLDGHFIRNRVLERRDWTDYWNK